VNKQAVKALTTLNTIPCSLNRIIVEGINLSLQYHLLAVPFVKLQPLCSFAKGFAVGDGKITKNRIVLFKKEGKKERKRIRSIVFLRVLNR
jgi:hypothetical protein